MAERIDARGLSCPQPVVLTSRKMKEIGKGVFEVLIDTETSKENICRLARQMGWGVESKNVEDDCCLVLRKDK
jgi:tRNA 2-thiouridine synthesizing protein A